jgi:hypothetical protein
VVELMLKVFTGAGVVEPAGAAVETTVGAPNRLEPVGLVTLENRPPEGAADCPAVEVPLPSCFGAKLNGELDVAVLVVGMLNKLLLFPATDVIGPGFAPKVGVFPVLPPNSDDDPGPELAPNIDPACGALEPAPAPKALTPEVLPPPKMPAVGFDVAEV